MTLITNRLNNFYSSVTKYWYSENINLLFYKNI